ncbi:sensor histidine kinase [Thalassotalea fusca]
MKNKNNLQLNMLNENTSPQSNAFWWCQIIGWGLFSLFNFAVRSPHSQSQMGELANSLALFVGFVVSTSLLRRYYKRFLHSDNTLWNLVQIFLASTVSAVVTELIVAALVLPNHQWLFGEPLTNVWQQMLWSMPNLIFFTLLWSAVYVVVRRQRQLRQSKEQAEQLVTSLKAAQLDVLMNQLNPHFVFNAINNIRALILEDKHKARDCLADLSEVMRVTMQVKQDKVWTFEQELQLVDSYLSLNKLQFEERLQVVKQIDEATLTQVFPCMMLQLLVENAIKHGINQQTDGGEITLVASIEAGCFTLRVSNPGAIDKLKVSTGVGLTNIKERLLLLDQQNRLQGLTPHFNLAQEDDTVVAQLTLGSKND